MCKILSCRFQHSHWFLANVDPACGCSQHFCGTPSIQILQQSLLSLLISSKKHTGIPVTKRAPVSPLHQIADDERYLKQSCPVRSRKSDYSKTSASIQSTNLHNKNTWHLLPDANCQSEHTPLQEQLQGCTKRDFYGCIFQLLLQFKPWLYLQAINVTMISTFDYKEGKKTNVILQESNILAKLIFKTSMMVLYGC